jgi:hypothetical protein
MDVQPASPEPSTEPETHEMSVNEYFEVPYNFWQATAAKPAPVLDRYYSEDEGKYFRYELKPLGVMLPFGTLGLLLVAGQMLVPYHLWQVGRDDMTGYLRLAMFLGGAFCVFMAWPRYRDLRTNDAEEAATEEVRDRIARIRR